MEQHLKLIDGTFKAEDAVNVLLGLVSYKINYHQNELFLHKEQFGSDVKNSEKRITELKKLLHTLKQKIDEVFTRSTPAR